MKEVFYHMTWIEFYVFSLIASIVLCIPFLALANSDRFGESIKEGFKEITIKDIFLCIGTALIPLFNFIFVCLEAFVVVLYPIIGFCMYIFNKDFWDIHPFKGKDKPVKEETNFERKMKLAEDCYEEMSGVRKGIPNYEKMDDFEECHF